MKNILMIIPPERFRDEELFQTKEELEKYGHKISISSTHKGRCQGSRGGFANSDYDIKEIDTNIFDAVVYVGGGGSKLLFYNEIAIRIAKEMNDKGKIVAAICLAPVILANAGILEGKNATVVGTEAKTIENKGAKYTGPGVTVDKNIVTANAPKTSRLFGETIGKLIDKNEKQE
jgi:protease I